MSELFTLDTLQEFFAKRPKGARIEADFRLFNSTIGNWKLVDLAPNVGSSVNEWRWEPQSKPIDLSPLVGSDVLCEFVVGTTCYGFLRKITPDFLFISEDLTAWGQCKPVMNKWMAVNALQVIPVGLVYVFTATDDPSLMLIKIKRVA